MSERPLTDKQIESIEDALHVLSTDPEVSLAFELHKMNRREFIADVKTLISYYDRNGARTAR